jgi:uncharacterized C2H2 Zn-finger protein
MPNQNESWRKKKPSEAQLKYWKSMTGKKGKGTPRWKGETANIYTMHQWLRANVAIPDRCSGKRCPRISKTFDWCLKTGRKYSHNPKDYIWHVGRAIGSMIGTIKSNYKQLKIYTGMENKQDWRERFDEARKKQWNGGSPYFPDWDKVESFIASELNLAKQEGKKEGKQEERERIVGEIERLKLPPPTTDRLVSEHLVHDNYNQALSDIKNIIK